MKDRDSLGAQLCPCGSGVSFVCCCQLVIEGVPADTAEVLMRSRYTAFTLHDADYLFHSWHPDTRPAKVELDLAQRWLGLKIRRVEGGRQEDSDGVVCFAARYKVRGRGARLEECSRFVRLPAGRWVYLDGQHA